ncbi:MAG: asparaginase [Tissierellia bacterium]|nr:asparaginase [Tissierellia bacterium]
MEKLITTLRGDIEDLYTFGIIVVSDSSGKIIYHKGDCDKIAYPRSSFKLMQAMTPLSLNAKELFNLNEKEIAIISASHSGEDFHIETVLNLLEKINLDESYLKCGAHYPFKEEVSLKMKLEGIECTDIHNNCSGKHVGMLMSAKILNAPLNNYYELKNPVQQKIRDILETICETKIPDSSISVDGCGVPVHALSMRAFAHGMAKMADFQKLPDELAIHAKEITNAITKYPQYASGTDRIDYKIISKYPKDIIVKSGANGYFGGYLPKQKLGFAIKTFDGITDTRNIILVELLKKLDIIKESDYDYFDEIAPKDIKNHRKEKVGKHIVSI